MTDLADIFRQYGNRYVEKYNAQILPSHQKAMHNIINCRTPSLGGQSWRCDHCGNIHYSYHSCRNRHCPKCQNDRSDQWLQKQLELLLPIPYFMATITVPKGLRMLFRSHQKLCYNLLFRASVQAIMTLTNDPKYLGADVGMMGVLQTWARNLVYHPHIHFLITGGGVTPDGKRWKYASDNFLVHVKPLSILIRAKFKQALNSHPTFLKIPANVWKQSWVCHIEPVGSGEAILKYLTPYIFRVAISDKNILSCKDGKVSFRYKDAQTKTDRIRTMDVLDFIHTFLQHVLPRGFVKVRYFGFLATRKRSSLVYIKELINERFECKKIKSAKKPMTCPHCGHVLIFIAELPRHRGPPS